jgi:hypothetical protein
MKIAITEAILAIKKDAQVSVSGNNINTIEWHDGNPTNITNEQIVAKQIELQTEEDNKEILKEQNKQSALNKLKALGLNDAEINSILGN